VGTERKAPGTESQKVGRWEMTGCRREWGLGVEGWLLGSGPVVGLVAGVV
jgi:hypothetical protein